MSSPVTTFAYSGVEGNIITEPGTSSGGGTIPGGDVDMQKWDIKYEVNTFDKTTTADAGWDSTGYATKKVKRFVHVSSTIPPKTRQPFSESIQASFADVKMYINKTYNIFFSASDSSLTGLSYKSVAVKEGVPVVASFVNNGPWIVPSPASPLGSRSKQGMSTLEQLARQPEFTPRRSGGKSTTSGWNSRSTPKLGSMSG